MTPQDLKSFRESVPECELAVYADLASQTVLSAQGALQFPQEYLDALCASAVQIFGSLPPGQPDAVDHVVFLGPTGGRGFVRDPKEPDEVLCCILAPRFEARDFIRKAVAAMRGEGRVQ